MRTLLRATTLAALFTLAACSDLTSPSNLSPARTTPAAIKPRERVSTSVTQLVDALFYRGPASALYTRFAKVKTANVQNSATARREVVAFIDWVRQQAKFVRPPAGETAEHAMERLVLFLLTQIYEGPDADTPPVNETSDIGSGLVEANSATPDTVQTPADQAAVIFPAGAVSEPTLVIISENETPYDATCSGPLNTTRCQYPLFYKYSVFPDQRLNAPARVAVCHVNEGDHRAPLADHDRFRLAHQRPADPAAYVPGGTVEGDIEILPLADVGPLVTCEHTNYEDHEHADASTNRGLFASVLAGARSGLSRAGSFVGELLTPKDLYAIDRGGGGSVLFFSDFNVVDPMSAPDLHSAAAPTLSSNTVIRGQQVTVFPDAILNSGTAVAGAFTPTIVMAQDAALTTGVQLTFADAVRSMLAPGDNVPVVAVTLTIPATTPAGTYWIGVRADGTNSVDESDETNNVASVQITVRDPYTLLCASGGPGAHASLAAAVANTQPGGTIQVCAGEYSTEGVLIDKPLTIESSANPKPVFRTVSSLEGILLRHTTGMVTMRRIAFRNDYASQFGPSGGVAFSYSIRANTSYANITIEDADFTMLTGGHASGMIVSGGALANNSALTIVRSTFTGGRAALAVTGTPTNPAQLPPSSLLIANSRFEHQRAANPTTSNFALQVQNVASAVVTENVIADCGDRCLNITGSNWMVANNDITQCGAFVCVSGSGSGVVAGNRMSNRVTGEYDPFFHHVVLATGNSVMTVENNEIDGCGRGQCITAIVRANVTIRNNRIRAYRADRTNIGIVLSDNAMGNAPETDRGAIATVTDNIIEGSGDILSAPDDPASYSYYYAALQAEGHSTMTATHNTINGANQAFTTRTGSSISAARNTVSRSRLGVLIGDDNSSSTLNWNDFSVHRAFQQGGTGNHNLTCNWWGSATGPANFSAQQPASLYTPWATAPVAAAGTGPCDGAPDVSYTALDLGTASGMQWAEAMAINNAGQIVGRGGVEFPGYQAWRWTGPAAGITNLPNPCGDWYQAYDVNSAGVVAMGSAYCGMLYDPATGQTTGVPSPPDNQRNGAYGINDNNLVLACYDNGSYAANYVFNRATGAMTVIPGFANVCFGKISNTGLAVISSEHGHTGLWNHATHTAITLPGMSGRRSRAVDVNDAGVVVGQSCTDAGQCRAWRWTQGQTALQDLGTLGGTSAAATAINAQGYIVGWSMTASGQKHAFVWNPATQLMKDLGVIPGFSESAANGINDSGVIVGAVGVPAASSHAARWTPNP